MKELLQESISKLEKPLRQGRRKLLIVLNSSFVILATIFLVSERESTGNIVPHTGLLFFYIPAFITNFVAAIYNFVVYQYTVNKVTVGENPAGNFIKNYKKWDKFFDFASFIPVMGLCTASMIGYGNPSRDSLLADFAFGHALIIGVVIVMGRRATGIWTAIIFACLMYVVYIDLGPNYRYHYQTPQEAIEYEKALANREAWALNRQEILKQNGLNPPKAQRYFNEWFIFIFISFLAAMFYVGAATDLHKIIPSVIDDIRMAIQSDLRRNLEKEHIETEMQKGLVRVGRYQETVARVTYLAEKMEWGDQKKFAPILRVLKDGLAREEKEEEWKEFETTLNTIHNNFFRVVQEMYPDLSQNEWKLLAYIRMNMSRDEIASRMDLTKASLRTYLSALKKKMAVSPNIDIETFVNGIEA
jgi:DNA-binding CsgD family transcriptional regulator